MLEFFASSLCRAPRQTIATNSQTAAARRRHFLNQFRKSQIEGLEPRDLMAVDSITALNTPFVENFDGMGSAGTAALPSGFRGGADYATGATTATFAYGSTGTGVVTGTSSGGIINWANGVTASSTDRALGFLNTGSYTSPKSFFVAVTNNSGSTITSLNIEWDYEKYRSGSRQYDWTFFHGSTSAATIAETGGNQSYAADAGNATVSNPPLTTAKSVSLTGLSIPAGTVYYLRWTYTGLGGSTNGQGIGIDNLKVTAAGSAAAPNVSPTNTVPAAQTTNEDTPLVFSTANSNVISIADPDAATGTMLLQLSVTNGTLTLGSTTNLAGTGNGTDTLSYTGTLADLNAALQGLSFAPTANFSGNATLTITSNDQGNTGSGGALSDTDTVAITVTPVNDAPTLQNNLGLTVAEGAPATVITGAMLQVNDVDNTAAQLIYTVTALPTNGILTNGVTPLALNGTFTQADIAAGLISYAHNGSETTTDSFTFTVSDGTAGIPATVFPITITPVNDIPTLTTNAGLTVAEGAPATVITNARLLVSDNDNLATALLYTVTLLPTGGTLAKNGTPLAANDTFTQADIDGGLITYAHAGGEAIGDSFTFTVTDGAGGNIPATTFAISITPVNDAPTLTTNAGLTVAEGAAATTITNTQLLVSDVDNTPLQLTYTLGTAPTFGTLSLSGVPLAAAGTFTQADINSGLVKYAHNGSETTADSFTFTVSDGTATIPSTTFNITITPVNDLPVLATNSPLTVAEGAPATTIANTNLLTTDADATAAQLVYTVTLLPTNGVLSLSGSPLLVNQTFTQADINNSLLKYAHNGSETTSDSFTFTVSDGTATLPVSTFNITITPVNDAPTLTNNVLLIVAEGATNIAITSTNLLASDAESPATNLTYTLSSVPANGTLALSGTPLALNGTFTQANINSGLLTYSHSGSETTSDSFMFTVSDGTATLPVSTFNITITPVNDAPVLATNSPLTVAEGAAATTITSANLVVTDADNTAAQLIYTVTSIPANGVLSLSGSALAVNQTFTQADINNSLLKYAHNGSETTSDSFTFTVTDGAVTLPGSTFSIMITAVNDPPTLTNNTSLTVAEGATNAAITSTNLLVSDGDTGAAGLTYTLTAVPANGTLALSGAPLGIGGTFTQANINAGLLTYSHNGSETTSDSFTFTVSDGNSSIAATTFSITVTPVNDTPTLTTNIGLTVAEGAAATTIASSQLAVTDPDATPVQVVYTVTVLPTNGVLSLGGAAVGINGTFTQADINAGLVKYAHNGSETTSDSFTFTVSDSSTGSIPTTIFAITVTPVNDAPVVATNAGLTVSEGAPATVIGSALLNATDVDSNNLTLTYAIVTLPTNGTLSVNGAPLTAAGTFTQAQVNGGQLAYAHNGSETTSDSFSFTVSDGAGGSTLPTIFAIAITAVNDPPVLATNSGLTNVPLNTSVTLTGSNLLTTDADNTATQLVYTVGTAPAGTLTLTGTGVLTAGGTFTQDDINTGKVSYAAPAAGVADSFTFTVSDGTATLPTATFTIGLIAANTSPTIVNNVGLTLAEGATSPISNTLLQVTDAQQSAANLTYTITAIPANGVLLLNSTPLTLNGTFTQADINAGLLSYTHNGSETTGDSFTFTVADGAGGTIPATTFTITITAVNDAPVLAVNTGLTVFEGDAATTITSAQLAVTDVDNGAAQIVFTVLSIPANGTLALSGTALGINATFTQADINNGLVTYAHNGSETTSDTFSFSVTDGNTTIASTPFAITVTPVNDAPVLSVNAGLTVAEGAAATVITSARLAVTDADTPAASITFTVTATPANGTLLRNGTPLAISSTFTQADINNGLLSYTHNGSETTSDAFSFTVSDGAGGTIAATTFAITVTAVNDAPVLAVNTGLTVAEGATATTITTARLQVTDVDTPAAQITYTVTALPANGTLLLNSTQLALNGTFTQADINNGLLKYTHNGSETTSDSFSFTVSDGAGGSISATTLAITVTPVNDAPTIAPQTFAIAENSANGTSVGTVVVVDPDLGDTKSFSITAGNGSGAFAINPTTGQITVANSQLLNFETTPTFSLTVQVTDSGNQSASNTITINLTDVVETVGVSVTPTSGLTTTEAGGVAIFNIVLTSQPTADVTISLGTSDATEGTPSTNSVTFTPLNWNVPQVITITGVDDALVDGDIAYSIITGAAVSTDSAYSGVAVPDVSVTNLDNDTASLPTISDIANQTTLEDTPLLNVPFTVGDAETAAASLTVTTSSSDTTLFPTGSITLGGSGANRTISLSPAANLSGVATITVTVDDGSGGLTSDTFTITVTAVNDAPTLSAIASIPSLPNGSGLQTINLTGITAGGGESQTLTVTAVSSNPALIPNPTITYTSPNSTGSLSFTPVAGQSGTATITVTVTDNGGTANGGVNTITRTFTVTIAPSNTTPNLVAVIPDVENPGKNVLVINGSQSIDLISVVRSGNRTLVVVPLSRVISYFDNSTFDRILINGLAGHDRIILDPLITKPATINGDDGNDIIMSGGGNDVLHGGAGNDFIFARGGNDFVYGDAGVDYLYGEAGNDVILGGAGNDWISGGEGADILNGGEGLDTIFGDGGDDLIISGNFSLATNTSELLAIQAIWTSSQPFNTRITNLASKVNSTTVTSDGKFDWVYTGAGRDWVVDYALMDLLFDFNYSTTSGDKRN
ncbi:beta strand repeat-containing protein [Anatilimnocola floriformis]|uniref:beta strand repeat-containing protein n=1 Tax=Anatilimnocola floriformis TaxID=2948575 RepID=UPI0020C47A3D|nr:cadherin-like domain-containing protein [Anatilimnocola floriformis]